MVSKYSENVKMIEFVCKNYISLNSNGKIEFKSLLNSSIKKGEIYKIDALYIILDLIYRINNGNINKNIENDLKTLINEVKKYNLEFNYYLMNDTLFFKDYTNEKNILSEYLESLDFQLESYKKFNKDKLKRIKSSLNHLSIDDLCYILDYNPELNFYKKKELKNQVANKFIIFSVEENKLKDASCEKIKNYLNSLVKPAKPQFDIDEIMADYSNVKKIETNKIKKQINHYSTNFHKSEGYSKKVAKTSPKLISKSKPKKTTSNVNKIKSKTNNNQLTVLKYRKQIEFIKNKPKKAKSNKSVRKYKTNVNKNISHDVKKSENINDTAPAKIENKITLSKSDIILEKIRVFNDKLLSEMLILKSKYKKIYDEISEGNFLDLNKNKEVRLFKFYYENFDKIEDSIKIMDQIRQKQDLIHKFCKKVNHKSFTGLMPSNIILEFKELYIIVHVIKDYPPCIKSRIFDEFDNLKYFIQEYELLIDSYCFKTDIPMKKIKLVEKINSFLKTNDIEEIISFKDRYNMIYQEIPKNIDRFKCNLEVLEFIESYECYQQAVDLINKIKENEELLNKFCITVNNGNLSKLKRNSLIIEFKDFYDFASKIYSFTEAFEYIIFNEFSTFGDFMGDYEELLKEGENQINWKKEFFKDIDDPNKKRAILCDEDNVKVVAGAGAGKTFIIEKKVNYLIKNGMDPEKILCLCYTKKGVNQLNKKVNKQSNDPKVKVFTFHEFCRRVSRECGEDKSSNRYLLDKIIRNYVEKIVRDPKKLDKLCQYFSYYSRPQLENIKFDTLKEYEEYHEQNKFVSLKKKYSYCDKNLDVSERKKYSLCHKNNETVEGECVKSTGELLIANYLFMHNIEYIYENQYLYNDMADVIENRFLHSSAFFSLGQINEKFENERLVKDFINWERNKKYFPDFYLPKYDIYIEHFGVDKNMEATFLKGEDKEKYERDMKYKSIQHSIYGTKLIKTYWYYLLEDNLLKKLEEELKKYPEVEIKQRSREEIIDILINNDRVKDFTDFSNLIKNFINIYESKNLIKADFNKFRLKNTVKDVYAKNRQNLFFDIAEDIYNEYYDENSKGTLSHNHEIFNALKLIKTGEFNKKYDYIFVDEYQDVNPVRCRLLQELQKSSNAKLFVVGDDWQSIYGFTGSKVDLFTDFDKYFENPEVVYIEENRRNPQKLIDISSEFIVKYNGQDKRKLQYYKPSENQNLEPIKIVKYNDNWRSKTLKLDAVIDNAIKQYHNPKILILGRNNDDIDDYVGNVLFKEEGGGKIRKIIYYRRPDIDITFMTIHQAKGLEADEVIVLNLEDREGGFPNKMNDDPILHFVKDEDEIKFEEERRLLYVALTRSRNNVYLFTLAGLSSQFINDLKLLDGVIEYNVPHRINMNDLPDSSEFIEEIVINKTHLDCPHCNGKISIIENNVNKTTYVRCSNYPRSKDHYDGGPYPKWALNDIKYVKKCPKCRGILVRNGDILKCSLNYTNGCMERDELKLDKEDLEFDYD